MKCCVALVLLGARALAAEIVYDNTDNFLLKVNNTLLESGDQVRFEGDNRIIDYFAFEYFATPSAASHEGSARVRFYLNDEPATNGAAAPGTMLYDSGIFLLSSNSTTVEISHLGLYVPADTLTWTVQFSNIATNEKAGALFFDPPTVGSSGDFLWERGADGWQMIPGTNGMVYNLSARFEALPALRLKTLKLVDSAIVIAAAAFTGKSYFLEYKTSVDQESWVEVEHSMVLALGPEVILTDPSGAAGPMRIYRVVERAIQN